MNKYTKNWVVNVIIISLVPIILVYLPFALKMRSVGVVPIKEPGMYNIVKNWDGPNYIVVAKSFYEPSKINQFQYITQPPSYYTAHLPLFPLLIAAFAPVFGWLYSGVVVNILFGILLNLLFYTIAKRYTKHPLLLTAVFTIFPARFLSIRSVIAPETLLVFLMLLSFFLWEKKKYFGAAMAGAIAVFAKVQALFLFPAYAGALMEGYIKKQTKFKLQQWVIVLIPTSFVLLCGLFYYLTGDFLAFMNAQSKNGLALSIPFSQFNYSNVWSNTGWLEEVVIYISMFMLLCVSLWKHERREWFYFAVFYSAFLICLPHRDITRYAYPLVPLFLFQFSEFFTSKNMKWALLLAFPAIYLYSINFILTNQAPIIDWMPFVK